MKKEYYVAYKPEYERIKRETLEAKSTVDQEDDQASSILNKDSLIEFDDGLYKDSDEDEQSEEENYQSKRPKTISTIPEEDEDEQEKMEYRDFITKLKLDSEPKWVRDSEIWMINRFYSFVVLIEEPYL